MTNDDAKLASLIDRIVRALAPEAIYLFGSRARGEQRADSDYDLLVVVPDATTGEKLAPAETYGLAREAHVAADIVTCRKTAFERWRGEVGTLSYEASRFGRLVYGQ